MQEPHLFIRCTDSEGDRVPSLPVSNFLLSFNVQSYKVQLCTSPHEIRKREREREPKIEKKEGGREREKRRGGREEGAEITEGRKEESEGKGHDS